MPLRLNYGLRHLFWGLSLLLVIIGKAFAADVVYINTNQGKDRLLNVAVA